jgi:hypothetical protein
MGIKERVAEILAGWYGGRANYGDIEHDLMSIVNADDVEEVMAALPVDWRNNMLQSFRQCRDVKDETELVSVFGGVLSWEHESDPVLRERLGEEERARAVERRRHFMNVTLPAIQLWLARHDPRG